MTYIGSPPAERLMPMTRGCDKLFTVQRTQSGSPTAFDAGTTVYIYLDIDRANPTKVDAVVSGSTAAFNIPSTTCDLARSGTKFRIVLDYGTVEIPLIVGKVERHDG